VRGACRIVRANGEARTYGQAHLVARWLLGLYSKPPVACRHCGVLDTEQPSRLVSPMHAALDWRQAPQDRLRTDYAGRVYSTRPDLDYIALCTSCHRRYDVRAWRELVMAEPATVP
jgi:hypothetical protein